VLVDISCAGELMLSRENARIVFSALLPFDRPAALAVLLLFFVGFADGSILPFFALWAQNDAGISVSFIGPLLACYAGGELIATPLIGGIADRIGRRPVIMTSTAGVGMGFVLLSFTHGLISAILLLLWIGICESVVHPTLSTVIADSAPVDQQRRQFARGRVASNAGRILGPLCGAVLAKVSLGTVFLAAGRLCWWRRRSVACAW
jgi:DHA1 family tetracycline resistance protein-like MFS transporter